MSSKDKALALCRVSSVEQLANNSLNRQRESVARCANELNVEIPKDGWWSGSVSSKRGTNVTRKDLIEILERCKRDKHIKYLIVDEPDRFMRSVDEAAYFEVSLGMLGVRVWYASDPELNTQSLQAKLLKFTKFFSAEGSNDERQRKSINGQVKAMQEGRYTFHPKAGYCKKLGNRAGVHVVHPTGRILQSILVELSENRLTPTQALVKLNRSEFTKNHLLYKMDKFRKIATDPYYAGILEMDKQVKVRNEYGLHEPILTKEQHLILVDLFERKKKNQTGPRKNGNPKYPLNNLVTHSSCSNKKYGRFVGIDLNNGKNKNRIYEKYRCRACRKCISRTVLHEKVTDCFQQNVITQKNKSRLIDALREAWSQDELEVKNRILSLSNKKQSLERSLEQKIDAVVNPKYEHLSDRLMDSITTLEAEIREIDTQIAVLRNNKENDWDDFLAFAFDFIDKTGKFFLDSSVVSQENRLRCKQIIIPAGFCIDDNENVYTPEVSIIYRLAGNKKDAGASQKSLMVRVRRL